MTLSINPISCNVPVSFVTIPEFNISSLYLAIFNFSEPQSGFRIAFNMFDTDGNERIDKNEFLVVSIRMMHVNVVFARKRYNSKIKFEFCSFIVFILLLFYMFVLISFSSFIYRTRFDHSWLVDSKNFPL